MKTQTQQSQLTDTQADGLEKALTDAGYLIAVRDPSVKPKFAGTWMVIDPLDNEEGFAIVGDDRTGLIQEACGHLDLVAA